jgi:hypothetical protein
VIVSNISDADYKSQEIFSVILGACSASFFSTYRQLACYRICATLFTAGNIKRFQRQFLPLLSPALPLARFLLTKTKRSCETAAQ